MNHGGGATEATGLEARRKHAGMQDLTLALAVRYSPRVRRYFDTKKAQTNSTVAFKAVAHKLARAAWHIMRTHESFDENRAFG